MRETYTAAVSLTAVLVISATAPAFAQDTATQGQPASLASQGTAPDALEEVIVTARRREESTEKVPSTVDVLTSAAIVELNLHTYADLETAVPGLVIRTQATSNAINFVVRGESLDSFSGAAPGVQPYVNEVPISATAPVSYYDMSSIQVLKGPQGTLFGRNTTGGAVLFETTQPSDVFGGYASIQYGNYNRQIMEAAVNLPMIDDKAALRIAGTHTSGGAWVDNIYNGEMEGSDQQNGGRATLLLKPVDELKNVTTLEYDDHLSNSVGGLTHYIVPCGQQGGSDTCLFEPSNPNFQNLINGPKGSSFPGYPAGYVYPGGLATLPAFLDSLGPYHIDNNVPTYNRVTNEFVANTTTLELSKDLTIKNIFGFSHIHAQDNYDNDSTPYPILQGGGGAPGGSNYQDDDAHVYSDELQLQGQAFGDRLTYLLGLFYNNYRDDFDSPVTGFGIVGTAPGESYTYAARYHAIARDETNAVFTQTTFAITDRLNLTTGVRGTWDHLSQDQGSGSAFGAGQNHESITESKPSWTVSLDYHLTPSLMTYVTTRASWRVGGYDPSAPPLNNTGTPVGGNYFWPETVRDVEVGAKFNGHFGNTPIQLNVDFYNSWIHNVQKVANLVLDGVPDAVSVNVPAAEMTGVEADFQVKPVSWLRIGGNVSYNDARFTNGETTVFGVPAIFAPYGDAPRESGTLYSDISLPLPGDAGTLTYHVDAFAQSYFYISNEDYTVTPGSKVPGYALLDMRLDWANPVGLKGLTGSLYVKNLAGKVYYTGGAAPQQEFSLEYLTFGQPRTYGVILRYDF